MKFKKNNFIISVIVTITGLIPASIFAQQLSVKASFEGLPANGFVFINVLQRASMLDFNRDGIPDKSFIDPQNESLVILSGSDELQKWIIPLSNFQYRIEQGRITRICGFYEMDGNTATTEVVIATQVGNRFWSPVIVTAELDKSSPKLAEDKLLASPDYFLLGIKDIDNDGKDDIIVVNTTEQRIEVLSY